MTRPARRCSGAREAIFVWLLSVYGARPLILIVRRFITTDVPELCATLDLLFV